MDRQTYLKLEARSLDAWVIQFIFLCPGGRCDGGLAALAGCSPAASPVLGTALNCISPAPPSAPHPTPPYPPPSSPPPPTHTACSHIYLYLPYFTSPQASKCTIDTQIWGFRKKIFPYLWLFCEKLKIHDSATLFLTVTGSWSKPQVILTSISSTHWHHTSLTSPPPLNPPSLLPSPTPPTLPHCK